MRYDQLRPKYRAFLQGFPVTMVTYYVAIMTACYSATIAVSYGNTTLLPRDSVKVSIFLISEALESVETGLSHLKLISDAARDAKASIRFIRYKDSQRREKKTASGTNPEESTDIANRKNLLE